MSRLVPRWGYIKVFAYIHAMSYDHRPFLDVLEVDAKVAIFMFHVVKGVDVSLIMVCDVLVLFPCNLHAFASGRYFGIEVSVYEHVVDLLKMFVSLWWLWSRFGNCMWF